MEHIGGLRFSDASSAVRKRRSNTSRRPRNDSKQLSDYRDVSSLSSTPPPSDNNMIKNEDVSLGESDEASNSGSYRGSNEQRPSGVSSRRSSEGVLAPANWKGTNTGYSGFGVDPDGLGNENKFKKVKLKVGGVIHTIDANSASDGASAVGSYATKSCQISEAFPQRKFIIQEEFLDDNPFTTEKVGGLQGVPRKDFARSAVSAGRAESSHGGLPGDRTFTKQFDKYEPARKSKRVLKKRLLDGDGVLDDGVDDEIRYLEKVKASKVVTDYDVEYKDEYDRGTRKQRKRDIDGLYDVGDRGQSVLHKECKKSKSVRASDDVDYREEEEPMSDGETETIRNKPKKEFIDSLGDPKREMTVTTRQRALQTGTDVSPGLSASVIEFPNGLPPAPKKQKEKLSEVEQQLKRAEALQRRRMQVQKAARESEAEAIRKILGQDSSRKKKEDKIKKRQEEHAQEKAANAMILKSDSVRWVMSPSGTIVTFPNEVGLPSIFAPRPCSYPPPREKCAGPSCTNPYKYRDSKSKLPLCSLQCYKAVHEKMKPVSAC